MNVKAKLESVAREFKTFRVTFITYEDISDCIEALQNVDLRLTAEKWRVKRSLSANAYYYVLLGKIAERAGETLTEAHNQTIADYGQADGNKILLLDDIDWRKVEWLHLKPTPEVQVVEDNLYRAYLVMRGSHTYDTAEMSALIRGTIEDAKALGIETLTPVELEDMLRAYEINHREKRD